MGTIKNTVQKMLMKTALLAVLGIFTTLVNFSMASQFALTMKYTDTTGDRYVNVSSVKATNNDWFQLKGDYLHQPSGAAKGAILYVEGPAAGVDFYVDNLVLLNSDKQNIVAQMNGDFELGNTSSWFANGQGKISIDTTQTQSGNFSLLVNKRKSTWQGPAVHLANQLVAGQQYTVSIWVKLADAKDATVIKKEPQPAKVNSDFVYFYHGKTYGSWGLSLGDQDNWMLPANGLTAKSQGGQVIMTPGSYKQPNDAVHLKWTRKKGKGQFAIYGNSVNLASIEHKAALTMEIKVIKKPKGSVTVGMDCGYPCRSEIYIHKTLREFPKNEWQTFPIPLNCFSSKGLDVAKINGAFILATEKKFEVEVANVRMELLPEGAPTCQ